MVDHTMSEERNFIPDGQETKIILDKFQRAKILEIYFARFDGRVQTNVPEEYAEIYKIDLKDIKDYLLGQRPQDPIIKSLFRIMH